MSRRPRPVDGNQNDGEGVRMTRFSKEFLQETKKIWKASGERPPSEEDAREIAENVVGLFSFLLELDRKYSQEEGVVSISAETQSLTETCRQPCTRPMYRDSSLEYECWAAASGSDEFGRM